MYADSHPGEYGAIWVTGSQPFKLMRLAGESLAGRAGILHLLPLSQSEAYASEEVRDAPEAPLPFDLEAWRERTSRRQPAPIGELYRRMWRGTMPAVVSGRHADPSRFYRSYQQTYIERDVRELDRAADMVQFSRFMSVVASQVGQLLNVQSLARDLDMSRAKAQEWLGILERSDVIFLLQPYSNNSLSRTVSTPKLYFNDTGLAAWLGRWTSPESLEVGAMAGPLFENHVVSEFRKALNNTGDRAALWFYRDRDAREVDLVVERDATLHPVEIKRSANPRRTSTKAFPLLDKSGLARGTGLVVCMKEHAGVIDAQSLYVPAWAL
jgi:predicted AAA+ superfamily ATPase